MNALRRRLLLLERTSYRTVDRAVGHIEDTAAPGTDGNSGIAGHRDGFFRGLKDLATGDTIELDTLEGTDLYRVERTWVVNPQAVSVLNASESPPSGASAPCRCVGSQRCVSMSSATHVS